MRRILPLVVLGLLFCVGTASAQIPDECCAPSYRTFPFSCHTPSCSDTQDVYVPDCQEFGAAEYSYQADCCGQPYTNFYSEGGCIPVELRKPGAMDWLANISRDSDILVADCKGHYTLFHTPRYAAARRSFVADDPVIR